MIIQLELLMAFKINPLMITNIIKNYLSDINRFQSYDYDKIIRCREKNFLNLIRYAFTIPVYKKKYAEAGLKFSDIKRFEDIKKLPIITRSDFVENFPDGVISKNQSKKSVEVNTSGSTRNPLRYYTDQFTLMKTLIIYVRELRQYGFKWNKTKMSMIANFYSGTGPSRYFDTGAFPTLKPFFSLDNFQLINCDDDLKEIMKKLDSFKPDFLAGFPGPLRHMAILKQDGFGKNLNPKCIISSGGLLDKYNRKEIEDAFDVKIYDLFASTEAGPISFECDKCNNHINSDYIYLESIDRNGDNIPKGKPGILALTRLYGGGTPIIRYTGMGDIITLKEGFCDCSLPTDLIDVINGRIKECIVLPDGKIIFANKIKELPGQVIHELHTDMLHKIQVVQENLDKVEVNVIVNPNKTYTKESVDVFLDKIRELTYKLCENKLDVEVNNVKFLKAEEHNPTSTPGVLSKIKVTDYL